MCIRDKSSFVFFFNLFCSFCGGDIFVYMWLVMGDLLEVLVGFVCGGFVCFPWFVFWAFVFAFLFRFVLFCGKTVFH